MLADIIYCWKRTSFMAVDSVTSFLHLKDFTNFVNECDIV